MIKDLDERFNHYVVKQDSGCWLWTGNTYATGYGRIYIGIKDNGKPKYVRVHRWIYERINGPVGELTIDHLCHDPKTCKGGYSCEHRLCVNPEHLEAVTNQENLKRRSSVIVTHCPKGHEYSEENTYITKLNTRQCVECNRVKSREYQRNKRKQLVGVK